MGEPHWHVYEAYLEEVVAGWKGYTVCPPPIRSEPSADVNALKAAAIDALCRGAGFEGVDPGNVSYLPVKSPRSEAERPALFLAVTNKRSFVLSTIPLPWLSAKELIVAWGVEPPS